MCELEHQYYIYPILSNLHFIYFGGLNFHLVSVS